MLEILSDVPLPLNSPPLACCCPCLPKVPLVKKNYNRLKAAVFQTALVRPILIFIASVLWTDGSYTPGQISLANAYLYLTIMTTISTLIGMYGLVIVFRISRQHLKQHHLAAKFISIQLVLIFSNLQGSVLELLTTKNILQCVAPFSSKTRGLELHHLLLVMESFILGVLLHHYYRKEALHNHPQIENFSPTPSKYSQTPNFRKDDAAILKKDVFIFPDKIAIGNNHHAPKTKDRDYLNEEQPFNLEAKIICNPEYNDSLRRTSENVPDTTQVNKNIFKGLLKPARKLTLVSVLMSQQHKEQLIRAARRRITEPSHQNGQMIGLPRYVDPPVNNSASQQNGFNEEENYYAQNLNNNNNHIDYYNHDMEKEFYELADNDMTPNNWNFIRHIPNISLPEETSIPSLPPLYSYSTFSYSDHECDVNASPKSLKHKRPKSISIASLFSSISIESNETATKFDTNNFSKIFRNNQIDPNNKDLNQFPNLTDDVIKNRGSSLDNPLLTNSSCSSYTEHDTPPLKIYHNCNDKDEVNPGFNTYHLYEGCDRFSRLENSKYRFKKKIQRDSRRIEKRTRSLKTFKSLPRMKYFTCLRPRCTKDDDNHTKLVDNSTQCNIDFSGNDIE
ncbi:uncharacterized protein LOC135929171 [Gordionus sp. m RMFG-2023]|uniref:uncharacterized protein LOC135929171 n=1 Tax=Gordionus sp. m RMFG-2023 TaxID=3053472 RepID=UPI0031FC9A85